MQFVQKPAQCLYHVVHVEASKPSQCKSSRSHMLTFWCGFRKPAVDLICRMFTSIDGCFVGIFLVLPDAVNDFIAVTIFGTDCKL